jgi:hypothetical protein
MDAPQAICHKPPLMLNFCNGSRVDPESTRFSVCLASNQAIGNSPFVKALFLLPVALASMASHAQPSLLPK